MSTALNVTAAPNFALADRLRRLDTPALVEVLRGISSDDRKRALRCWYMHGRRQQLAPAGDWRTWLILAGRGFGKTRAGAEWVRQVALDCPGAHIALVGATLHEARQVMVEGASGVLHVGELKRRPRFEPSLRRLVWENGSRASLYSADEPDSLRGPQHSHAWGDEIAKWPHGESVWMNLQMTLRLGTHPRAVLTTTPRQASLLKALLADSSVAVTRGRTADNAANLSPNFVAALTAQYGGTRFGRQELDGELIEDVEGAFWSRALVERQRMAGCGDGGNGCIRVVVGVDPPADGGCCGIVVAGMRGDGSMIVLEDASIEAAAPDGWARAVVTAAERHDADRVVAEVNNGGAMVTSVLRAARAELPVVAVRASRGKAARAEPVALLYATGRVFHAGAFPELEDQLCGFVAGGYAGPGRSPDRADALVWAITDLASRGARRPAVRQL